MRVYSFEDLKKSLQEFADQKTNEGLDVILIDERDLETIKQKAFVLNKCDHGKFPDSKLQQFCLDCGEIKKGE